MEELARFVSGSERLTEIFGKWPSFHDAEVHEASLSRSDVKSGEERIPPTLFAKFHIWEMTSEVDSHSYFIRKNHDLVSLRFGGISELDLTGFNHQNVLFDLAIERTANAESSSDLFAVQLDSSYGLAGGFRCGRIEVLKVVARTPPSAVLR